MDLIEGVSLSKLCDYSFGDQSGQWSKIHTHFMKDANLLNTEFVSKVFEIKKSRDYMTLFIDNIRLYEREIKEVKPQDWPIVSAMMQRSNLLKLCANFPDMKFIIFTNLEDTPIDEYIFDAIPENVLKIYATNAISHGGKVFPAPYGIQRAMNPNDNRKDMLKDAMINDKSITTKLLYVSHNEDAHIERRGTKDMFLDKEWAIVDTARVDYSDFLAKLSNVKFMLCPRGNAIDCHRNWEVLYMRRVPIMKNDDYLKELFRDFPVLFVDDYSEVTEEVLNKNNRLFEEAQRIDLSQLDLNTFFEKSVKHD